MWSGCRNTPREVRSGVHTVAQARSGQRLFPTAQRDIPAGAVLARWPSTRTCSAVRTGAPISVGPAARPSAEHSSHLAPQLVRTLHQAQRPTGHSRPLPADHRNLHIPRIGKIKFKKLTSRDLQKLYKNLMERGSVQKRSGKGHPA